jgi:hypothetical protein
MFGRKPESRDTGMNKSLAMGVCVCVCDRESGRNGKREREGIEKKGREGEGSKLSVVWLRSRATIMPG